MRKAGGFLKSADEPKLPLKSMEQTLKEIEGLVSLPEIHLKFRRVMENPTLRRPILRN
jgi:hypothetical protein